MDRIVPGEMRDVKRWIPVTVERERETGDMVKKPKTRWTDPTNWHVYGGLLTERLVGFVLGDGWFGIDLDDCLDP